MIDFDKLTNYSRDILAASGNIMQKYNNAQIQPEHFMLAMLEDRGYISNYLKELDVLNEDFKNSVIKSIKTYPTLLVEPTSNQIYLSDMTKKMLSIAETFSKELKDEFISIETILLAMTKLNESDIQKLLASYNINDVKVLKVMKKI